MTVLTPLSTPRAQARGRGRTQPGAGLRSVAAVLVLAGLGLAGWALQLLPAASPTAPGRPGLVGWLVDGFASGAMAFAVVQAIGGLALAVAARALAQTCTHGWRVEMLAVVAVVAAVPVLRDPRTTIGLVLLAAALAGTVRTARDGRLRWWVPALAWVGALVHPLWLVAPLVGLCLVHRVEGGGLRRRVVAGGWLLPLLSLVAGAVTPAGPATLAAPLVAVEEALVTLVNRPTHSIREPGVALVLLALALVWAGWQRAGRAATRGEVATWVLAVGLAVISSATLAAAALVLPLLAGPVLDQLPVRVHRTSRRARRGGVVATLVPLVPLALAGALVAPAVVTDHARAGLLPDLRALRSGTVLVTSPDLVGLSDRADTNATLAIGTRPEDPAAQREALADALGVRAGWDSILREVGATAALLPADSAAALALQDQWDWTVAGSADGIALVVAP